MIRRLRQPLLVLVSICAAFTCVASVVVLVLTMAGHIEFDTPFLVKLAIRIGLFAVVAIFAAAVLWRSPIAKTEPGTEEPHTIDWRLALVPCAIAAIIAFPRLGATPHAEPDEWHHLNVAYNLAVHGLYASGSEEEGFILFDDYDSVGPPVILPIAAVRSIAGPEIENARFVMALFFIGFAFVVFTFCAPAFGSWPAVFSSLLAIGAWGSAYLGRSLYGEVPALMFFMLALMAGRASLQRSAAWRWGFVAGLTFGLAVLCKYYLLMAVWPLLGAFILDRITAKQIRWPQIISPALGVVAVLATWSAIQASAARDVPDAANAQLSMYQHNLLFGIEGLAGTTGFLATQPASAIAVFVGLLFAAWSLHKYVHDPAVTALWFFAGFQWFWWFFFNTGNLPRYSWYGWAAAAVLMGPLLKALVDTIARSEYRERLTRPLAMACCAAIVVPATIRTVQESQRAWFQDEMRHTRDLAAYVAAQPEQEQIATTFWPLERSVQFLSGRAVARLSDAESPEQYDVILIDASRGVRTLQAPVAERFGPYAAVRMTE